MLPYIPGDPNQVTIIDPGIPVRVLDSYIENQVIHTVSRMFGFSPATGRAPLLVDYSVKGVNLTVCTAFLQQSFDGGVTFQDIGVVEDLFANPQGNLTGLFAVAILVTSPIYRFRIVTLTATSITIDLAVS